MIDKLADRLGTWDNPLVYTAEEEDVDPILRQYEVSQKDKTTKPTGQKSEYTFTLFQ